MHRNLGLKSPRNRYGFRRDLAREQGTDPEHNKFAGGLTVGEDCTDMESVIHDRHSTNRITSNSMSAINSDARNHMNKYSHGDQRS